MMSTHGLWSFSEKYMPAVRPTITRTHVPDNAGKKKKCMNARDTKTGATLSLKQKHTHTATFCGSEGHL